MKILVIVFALFLSGCATKQDVQQQEPLNERELLLDQGFKHLSDRDTKGAIADFDKAIKLCKDQYSSTEKKIYASRGPTETLFYMLRAAADNESAIAVSPICSEALYLRGYASLDLGQIELAEKYVKRAIDMAPVNSMYLSELGHIYHSKREWENALDSFTKAENAAMTYSPPDLKNAELSRAKRGVGYSLIELGRLEEAEKKYHECLEIDKNDKGALGELKYIEEIRSKQLKGGAKW